MYSLCNIDQMPEQITSWSGGRKPIHWVWWTFFVFGYCLVMNSRKKNWKFELFHLQMIRMAWQPFSELQIDQILNIFLDIFIICNWSLIVVFYCCSGVFCVGFVVAFFFFSFSFQNKVSGIYIWCGVDS